MCQNISVSLSLFTVLFKKYGPILNRAVNPAQRQTFALQCLTGQFAASGGPSPLGDQNTVVLFLQVHIAVEIGFICEQNFGRIIW